MMIGQCTNLDSHRSEQKLAHAFGANQVNSRTHEHTIMPVTSYFLSDSIAFYCARLAVFTLRSEELVRILEGNLPH